MKTIYFSKSRAIELQDTAKTVKELDERFERSCSICPKAGYCDENKCFVAQTHNTKREVLKFRELIAEGKIKAPSTEIVHTRVYNICLSHFTTAVTLSVSRYRLNNRNKILGGSIMNKVQAHIHSLDGKFAEVTILQYNGDNDIIVEYNGKKCTAIYNIFAGYYVDDIYGVIKN